jgi:urease accessory protein
MQGLKVLPAGTWDSSRAVDSVLIDREAHHSGRMLLRTTGNRDVVVDVTHTALRPGDGLELDNGGVIQVYYAPERLLEIGADTGGDLVSLAWHLGNQHWPIQVSKGRIRLPETRAAEEILRRLGILARRLKAVFEPMPPIRDGHHHHHAEEGHAHPHR